MRNLRLDVFSTPWSICSQYLQETYCHRRFGVYSSLLLLAWRQGKGSSFCGEGGGSWDELRHVVEFACVVIPREEAPSFEMDNPESEKSVDLSGESRVCWKQASLEPAMGTRSLSALVPARHIQEHIWTAERGMEGQLIQVNVRSMQTFAKFCSEQHVITEWLTMTSVHDVGMSKPQRKQK
jgi:hypothetical protein